MSLAFLTWFAIPIGIMFLYNEKKSNIYKSLDDFYIKIINDERIENREKLNILKEMLIKNNFKIIEKTDNRIIGEKKHISLGWILIGIGLAYVGLIIYIIYYVFFLKAYRLVYEI